MTIPKHLQIFDHKVVLCDADIERLSPHLGNWAALHAILMLGVNVPDLERMVVIELTTNRRRQILRRLTARIHALTYEDLWTRIQDLI